MKFILFLICSFAAAPSAIGLSIDSLDQCPIFPYDRACFDRRDSVLQQRITVNEDGLNESVVFSPLKKHIDRNLYVARSKNSGVGFSLKLVKFEGAGSSLRFTPHIYEGNADDFILDTNQGVQIHGGKIKLLSAYDPSVVWHNGTYWVAFECSSPDFDNVVDAHASVCMGPLDSNLKMIRSKIRVVVMGGRPLGNSGDKLSASVPKLVKDNDSLYLLWSAVTIDPRTSLGSTFHTNRVAKNSYLKKYRYSGALVNNYQYFTEGSFQTKTHQQWLMTPLNSSYLQRSDADSFYKWQRNTLKALDNSMVWRFDQNGIHSRPREPYKFKKIVTYGARVKFHSSFKKNSYLDIPYVGVIREGSNINDHYYFSWDSQYRSTILDVKVGDKSLNTIADVFDVQRFGDRFYFTAAVGGTALDSERLPVKCLTPTLGWSKKGCYRLVMYSSENPLGNLNQSGTNIDIGSGFSTIRDNDISVGHEYSKFLYHPVTHKLILGAKFSNKFQQKNSPFLFFNVHDLATEHQGLESSVYSNRLNEGERLDEGELLMSENERFTLNVTEKFLFILDRNTLKVLWSVRGNTRLFGRYNKIKTLFTLQTDGHLVFYKKVTNRLSPLWASGKRPQNKNLNTFLTLQNDGNLVQYMVNRVGGRRGVIFHTGTNQ